MFIPAIYVLGVLAQTGPAHPTQAACLDFVFETASEIRKLADDNDGKVRLHGFEGDRLISIMEISFSCIDTGTPA